jgi:prevent-host-death family protein
MVQVNLPEARKKLSELVGLAERGEKVVIARDGVPVAELIPHVAVKGARHGGQWRGNARIPNDFDAPRPDVEKLFSA